MFNPVKESGFTLFELVALVVILVVVFAFGAPRYIECIHSTHNANIEIMVNNIKIWSSEKALCNLRNEGIMKYPLPNSVKINDVMSDDNNIKWDDTAEENWKYIAGGGIQLEGDGTYLDVIPIYIN